MKKATSSLILLVLLFTAGCNLPTNNEPTPDMIASAVFATLTAMPSATQGTPLDQNQLATASPEVISPTITNTIQPSETPSETATTTITPTETQNPNDPKANLGEPAWKSTLDSPNSFGLQTPYTDDNTSISISNGMMNLSSTSYIGYRGWRLTSPTPANFYLEATFKINSCSGNDQYGLIFRSPDYSSGFGYYFTLTCDGRYSLIRWDETGVNAVMNWNSDSAILTGTNQINIIGVQASGSTMKLFVNQKFLMELSDSKFTNGHFGAFVSGYSGNLSVSMDEIAYWNLP